MNKTNSCNFSIFMQLTKRHLLVFFKNKVRLMFTLLVPIIIFAVYLLFLRRLELSMVQTILTDPALSLDASVVWDGQLHKLIETLIDSWMLSGIIALSTITVALQTNTVIIDDKESGVNRDFASSPIRRELLIASYFLYNFIVSALICLVFYFVCLIYLATTGEFVLSFAEILLSLVVMFFATVASTLMTVFLCSFVKTEGTMMSIVAIFSTAVGFLIGAYMPLGMMPDWVQGICGFIPGTYACSLLRYAFMGKPMSLLSQYAQGLRLPAGTAEQLLSALSEMFGYNLGFFGVTVSPQFQALALTVYILLFLGLNIGVGSKLAEVLGIGKKKSR